MATILEPTPSPRARAREGAAGKVTAVVRAHDTILERHDGVITSIPERTHLYQGQAPQAFRYDLLTEAHRKALADGVTEASDDAQLVMRIGGTVGMVEGSYANFKIT